MFELGNIQNGFLGASIFKYPGQIEGDKERAQLEHDLRGHRFNGTQYLASAQGSGFK